MAKCAVMNCNNGVVWSGKGRKSRYCSEACKQKSKRVRANEKRVNLLREQRSKLHIVPVSLDTANAFVALHHRHSEPVLRAKFYLGILDQTGLLRGVAIIGRPVSRALDDTFTLEVNRCCTDGVPNGCSALYGAARKVAFDMGYQRLVTYTLPDEGGFSLRGAGWQKVHESKAHEWSNAKRPRKSSTLYSVNKWRWETVNPAFNDKNRPKQIILPEEMQEKVQPDLFSTQWEEVK